MKRWRAACLRSGRGGWRSIPQPGWRSAACCCSPRPVRAVAQPERLAPPMPVGKPAHAGVLRRQAPARGPRRCARACAAEGVERRVRLSGHPDMQASAIRAAAASFESCVEGLWPLAAKRNISRASFEKYTARADARPAHHGPDGRAAGVHQGVLGLSRHPGERRAHRRRPRNSRQAQGGLRQGREAVRRRPLHHHRDLGRRVRTTARSAATGRCCARPRRSPASAAVRPISATNFCRRWKSCIAAT